jgi:hypothetical protein
VPTDDRHIGDFRRWLNKQNGGGLGASFLLLIHAKDKRLN